MTLPSPEVPAEAFRMLGGYVAQGTGNGSELRSIKFTAWSVPEAGSSSRTPSVDTTSACELFPKATARTHAPPGFKRVWRAEFARSMTVRTLKSGNSGSQGGFGGFAGE